LTVIEQAEDYIHPNGTRRARWLCECSCPAHTRIIVNGDALKNKNGTRSCGCLQREFLTSLHENNKKNNLYDLTGEYGIGWTTNTNREFYFDLEDYDKIKGYAWREEIDHSGYHFLATYVGRKHTLMAWIIVGKFYDHEDRNPFNNRKYNLRPATEQENARNRSIPSNNTSGIIGVHWSKYDAAWVAQIGFKRKRIRLGTFSNKTDAVKTRLRAELEYFGVEFAPQRHLFEEYGII
jgi:hypothetical protein